MSRMLLVEDVFLLGHDDESGKAARAGLPGALAGALLLDLAERELIAIDDGKVVLTGAAPDHALLTRAVAAIEEQDEPRRISHWLNALPRALKPFDRAVGESLVERGVLAEEHGKVLGLFSTTRWPERDPMPEQHLRAELHDALLGRSEPSTRTLLLVGLLQTHSMLDGLVDKPDRSQARKRARELAKLAESSDVVSKAVGDAARAAQAAIMASVIASTTAATTATVTSN